MTSTRRRSRAPARSCSARCSSTSSPSTSRSTRSPRPCCAPLQRGEIMRWPARTGTRGTIALSRAARRAGSARARRGVRTSSRRCAGVGALHRLPRLRRASASLDGRCAEPDSTIRCASAQEPVDLRVRRPSLTARAGFRRAGRRRDGAPPRLPVHFFGLLGPERPAAAAPHRVRARPAAQRRRPDACALPRPVPPPDAAAVLPRLGAAPADGQPRPARRRPLRRSTSARWSAWACRRCAAATRCPTRPSCSMPAAGAPDAQRRRPGGDARRLLRMPARDRGVRRRSWLRSRRRTTAGAWARLGARAAALGALDDRSARASGTASTSSASCSARSTLRAVPALAARRRQPAPSWRRWCATTSATSSTGTCAWSSKSEVRAAAAASGGRTCWAGPPGSGTQPRARGRATISMLDPTSSAQTAHDAVSTADSPHQTLRREHDMAEISRVALFGKLNSLGYKAIESATVFCKLRGNPYVELVHWIHQILQLQDSDLHRIVRALPARSVAAGQGHDRGARSAAARRDARSRICRRTSRTRSSAAGSTHADVRRLRRCAPAT